MEMAVHCAQLGDQEMDPVQIRATWGMEEARLGERQVSQVCVQLGHVSLWAPACQAVPDVSDRMG